jgi:hypothetical protein
LSHFEDILSCKTKEKYNFQAFNANTTRSKRILRATSIESIVSFIVVGERMSKNRSTLWMCRVSLHGFPYMSRAYHLILIPVWRQKGVRKDKEILPLSQKDGRLSFLRKKIAGKENYLVNLTAKTLCVTKVILCETVGESKMCP